MRLFDADIMMELVDRLPFRNNEDVKNFIEVQPTVDAEPVRHAHWVNDFGSPLRCSSCGIVGKANEITLRTDFKFCPNCGAKMDEVTE